MAKGRTLGVFVGITVLLATPSWTRQNLDALSAAPSAPDDETLVRRLCASADPVLVVDHFIAPAGGVFPYIDVDGDGVPDVGHGDLIAAIYRAGGRAVAPLDMGGERGVEELVELFSPIAEGLESGRLRYAAINFSQVIDVSVEAPARDTGLPEPTTAENLRQRREELLAAVIRLMDKRGSPEFGELAKVFGRIRAAGVPILLAAGNQGPGKVNILGLFLGTVSVGALTMDGAKLPTSADNSLVAVWRRGEHVARRVEGGVDLNGDGRDDFAGASFSGKEPYVSRYVGRPASEVVKGLPSGPDWDIFSRKTPGGIAYLTEHLPEALYRTPELADFFQLPDAQRRSLARRGPYASKDKLFVFREDAQGRVVYDPEGSGTPGQVALLSGTSFAAPAVCSR